MKLQANVNGFVYSRRCVPAITPDYLSVPVPGFIARSLSRDRLCQNYAPKVTFKLEFNALLVYFKDADAHARRLESPSLDILARATGELNFIKLNDIRHRKTDAIYFFSRLELITEKFCASTA